MTQQAHIFAVACALSLAATSSACDDGGRIVTAPTSGAGSGPANGAASGTVNARPENFRPTPVSDPRLLGLPQAEDKTLVLSGAGDVEVRYDPNHALTALDTHLACLRWLTECHDATGGDLDGCVHVVPRCLTERPWEEAAPCCPATCADGYFSLRQDGDSPLDAIESVLGHAATCVPGYREWMESVAP
jgi:hypothetical protein